MKKIILTVGVVAVASLLALVSCKKEKLYTDNSENKVTNEPAINTSAAKQASSNGTEEISAQSGEVTSIINSPSISAALNSSQISGFDEAVKRRVENSPWFVYELTKVISDNEKVVLLAITNTNKKIVIPYVVKTTSDNNVVMSVSIKGLTSGETVGIITRDPKTGVLNRPTCAESTSTFNECFHCAMNELTDDLIGTIACAVHPFGCILVSAIHCAGKNSTFSFVSAGNNGNNLTNTNDIQAFVNGSISSGIFTTSIQEGNTFILN